MRSLSAVEAAVAFALTGAIVAVAVPEFIRGLHASRLVEPVDGLKRIGASAMTVAAGNPPEAAFPPSVTLTPAEVPRGVRADDPPGVWEQPTWHALGFAFDHPHAFSFSFESSHTASRSRFRATAHGDLDGDGVASTFEVEGEADANGARLLPGMYVDREVE